MIHKFKLWERALIYLGLFVFLSFLLLPFLEAFSVSLKPLSSIQSTDYHLIPKQITFDAYINVFRGAFAHITGRLDDVTYLGKGETVRFIRPDLFRYMFNSIFLATSITLFVLSLAIPMAYAFARFHFKGKAVILAILLIINMLSGAVLLIPLYRLMQFIGEHTPFQILDTYKAMIIPGIAFSIPAATWLLRSYIMGIPKEMEEAALVDGASPLYILRRIIIPLAMPGIIIVSISTFISAYAQQFLFAITFNSNKNFMPLPQGLNEFFGRQLVVWNELMAASLIGILPVMVVFLFLQKHLVAGLTAGAIK